MTRQAIPEVSRRIVILLVAVLVFDADAAFGYQQPGPSAPDHQGATADSNVNAASDTRTYPPLGTNGPTFRSMYAEPHAAPLNLSNDMRLGSLIRDGKLYLSLHDALAFAIDNNLNVEVQRYDLSIADADLVRAKGGGSTRGVDLSVAQTATGVGGPGSPLLNAAAVSVTPNSPTVLDLTSLNSDQASTRNLSVLGGSAYSVGSAVPLFDPQVNLRFGWLRRDDATTLVPLNGGGDAPAKHNAVQ